MADITPIIQTYSVLAIALAAGTNISTTIVTLPALLKASPSILATQWKVMYDTGITPVVTLTMSSTVGFATLAYRATYNQLPAPAGLVNHTKRNLYIAAAVAAFGLVPYTRLLMWGNITELEKRAKAAVEGTASGDTHDLVKRWGTLNLYRGFVLLTSAGLGVWACCN